MKVWLEILQRLPDRGVLLDLNKCADLRLVADLATIEIDELRKTNILSQLHVVRDCIEGVHSSTKAPLFFSDSLAASSILTTRRPAHRC